MIFAMSDVHGHFEAMKKRIDQIKPYLDTEDSCLILLGDFIDRGPASFECLQLAYNLQQEYGTDRVIVLRGNHEEWFLAFYLMRQMSGLWRIKTIGHLQPF